MKERKWITNAGVKCDKCDWRKDLKWSEMKEWHNVLCPKCGECIIVNDDDMAVINFFQAISDFQDHLVPLASEKVFDTVKIDTASLRK